MVSTLITLLFLYSLIGGSGLVAFLRAARRTNEDWEQHPAVRRMETALLFAGDHARSESPSRLPSQAS